MKKGVHFLAKGVAKMYGCKAAEKEKNKETFSKMQQRHIFWLLLSPGFESQ
jgi:hypothetical protein